MADDVTTSMGMTFRAFNVPNFAQVVLPKRPCSQESIARNAEPVPSIAIEDLSPAALDELALRWLDNLYAKCGRPSPFTGPSS